MQKTADPIEMLFGQLTLVGPTNHVLDGGPYRTNLFAAARDDKTAMRPFAKLLWTIVRMLSVLRYIERKTAKAIVGLC